MKINTIIFFISYFFLIAIIYFLLSGVLKDKKRFLKYSFLIYLIYLFLLLFFLENIYSTRYLFFNFGSDFFSRKYIMSTSINFKPFFILNFVNHKPTFLGYIFNIICFIPLGIYVSFYMYKRKWKFIYIIIILILSSSLIELLQFVLPINRVTDIDDIITNTIGGMIGFFVHTLYNYNNESKVNK